MAGLRFVQAAVLAVVCGTTTAWALSGESEPVDVIEEVTIRQTITDLDLLSPQERNQLLPWLFSAITQQPDAFVQGQLSQALDEKLARLADRPDGTDPQQGPEGFVEEIPGVAEEQESVAALLKQQQAPLPSEDEIRKHIDALTVDSKEPEVGLTQAMEIAGVIDRIEDLELQGTLRKVLEDRLVALQANLE